MARFFIDHPVFAMVIAIVIVILGAVAIPNLPVASYPEVVPPVVQITTSYLGGNSQDLEKTVAQPIEEQLIGLDGMLYFLSNSANDGTLNIQVTFKLGTNPDIATVQTQNRVNIAMPRLPPEVQRQGVVVKKVSTAFLTSISLISPDNRYDSLFLTNYAQINLLNQFASLEGVGECRLGANQVYSMRVWVNPDRMAQLGVTASDINAAIQAQNRQNPAGSFGQPPAPAGTDFQYSVSAAGTPGESVRVRGHRAARPPGHRPAAHPRHRPRATRGRRPTAASAASTASLRATSSCTCRPAPTRWRPPTACASSGAGQEELPRRAWTTSSPTTPPCSCARPSRK